MTVIARHGFVRHLLFLVAGPIIWSVHFGLVYAALGFGPAFGLAPAVVHLLAWGGTAAAGVAIVFVFWQAGTNPASLDPEAHHVVPEMTRSLAALSLVAVLLEGLALGVVSR